MKKIIGMLKTFDTKIWIYVGYRNFFSKEKFYPGCIKSLIKFYIKKDSLVNKEEFTSKTKAKNWGRCYGKKVGAIEISTEID